MNLKSTVSVGVSFRTRLDARPLPPLSPDSSLAERLDQIQVMGLRIQALVGFICEVAALAGTSTEAKEKAVAAFHERMVVLERELVRIQHACQRHGERTSRSVAKRQ